MNGFKSVVLAIAIAATASAGTKAEESPMTPDDRRLAVVQEMIDAWNTQNWERVIDLFGDDGVLHSMMVEPIKGRESIGARIRHMGEGIEQITLNIKHIGVIDGVVFLERVDEFRYNGHDGKVPVVGVIEVEGDRIKEWREYYDRQELLDAMGLAQDFDAEAR